MDLPVPQAPETETPTEPTRADAAHAEHAEPSGGREATATATLERRGRGRPVSSRSDFLDEDEYSSEEYDEMLRMYEETLSNIEEGQIVKAKVLEADDKGRVRLSMKAISAPEAAKQA